MAVVRSPSPPDGERDVVVDTRDSPDLGVLPPAERAQTSIASGYRRDMTAIGLPPPSTRPDGVRRLHAAGEPRPAERPQRTGPRPEPASWRRTIGRRLRQARLDAGLRLVDVAEAARVSPQYLSEVERGRKEASSEVLAAVTAALGMTLVDLAGGLAHDLARSASGLSVVDRAGLGAATLLAA